MARVSGNLSIRCNANDSSCDVPISEGPVNLTWGAIIKTINDDPYQFYLGGGWDFLTGGGDDSDEESSEEGSVFEEESDFGSESSESDESGSDFDDASDDSGSFDEESDEGEDWDELERKAERGEFHNSKLHIEPLLMRSGQEGQGDCSGFRR